jgi:flavin-dependent dehydrogenase
VDSDRSGHAVVVGAGVAGLLAARVLAEHYAAVTVLERDTLAGAAPRRGVPQGRHLHGLMEGGRAIIEALFPGITEEAVGRGAPVTEVLVGSRWYLSGLRACPTPTGLTTLLASRPLLESLIRDRVTALPGVSLRQGVVADAPAAAGGVFSGVRVRSPGGGDRGDLAADLVVDATGRASRAAEWLASAGLPVPVTERIDVDLGYSSRTYRHRTGLLAGDLGVVVSTMPGRRGGGAIRVEGDRWHVTLGGMLGDHPPTDHAEFESWAATLPVPDIGQLVAEAEPLDDPVPHRFTGSRRHFFERLGRHPAGFLVIGDALCSFNPLYAQGMTVAAQQALALRGCLREAGPGGGPGSRADLPGRFYAGAAPLIDVAWQMSTNADLNHPGVPGARTLRTRLTNAYVHRCHVAAHADPAVARTFMRVANLVEPATVLLKPGTFARVLRHGSDRGSGASGGAAAGGQPQDSRRPTANHSQPIENQEQATADQGQPAAEPGRPQSADQGRRPTGEPV